MPDQSARTPLPDLRQPTVLAVPMEPSARLLGQSYNTVYRAVKRGAIPTVTIPGSRRTLIPAWWLREQLGVTLADPDASTTHVSA